MLNKSVVLQRSGEIIPDIYALDKLGAGHDGSVFRFNAKALKILKYDYKVRRDRDLMTLDKALYFRDNLRLRRIACPIDVFFDEEEKFAGYVMDYYDDVTKEGNQEKRRVASFSGEDLLEAIEDLEEDFASLSKNHILARDINRGSYIYTNSFLHLCDTDKYQMLSSGDAAYRNQCMLNFVVAKMIALEAKRSFDLDKNQTKQVNAWVKDSANRGRFLAEFKNEIDHEKEQKIGQIVEQKVKKIIV